MPTLCMSSALDIIKSVNPPRAAFLDYPLGHTTGKPNEPVLQREILVEALDGFTSLTQPGSVKVLPHQWSNDSSWKKTALTDNEDGAPFRPNTPQYQNEEDRIRALTNLIKSDDKRPTIHNVMAQKKEI